MKFFLCSFGIPFGLSVGLHALVGEVGYVITVWAMVVFWMVEWMQINASFLSISRAIEETHRKVRTAIDAGEESPMWRWDAYDEFRRTR